MMSIKTVLRWLFYKITNPIVSLWNWKVKIWFRMGWSQPLKIKM